MLHAARIGSTARRLSLRCGVWLRACVLAVLAGTSMAAVAQAQSPSPLTDELLEHVRQLALQGARAGAPEGARVVVELGELDSRLRLAPCAKVQPYLPRGLQMWGRSRIGLRCIEGRARWNVSLPVTVQVFGQAVVAATPLPAGAELAQAQLRLAEVDIAAQRGQVFVDPAVLQGRTLQRPLAPGETLRSVHLRQRRWFDAGDRVRVVVSGRGYVIASEGQALEPGLEDRDVRVRFENGRTVTGRAIGERRVQVLL